MSLSPSAKLGAAANVLVVCLIAADMHGWHIPMFMSYFAHKIWHIVGAILLVGHATTGAAWFVVAWLRKDRQLLAFCRDMYRLLDIGCTVPGMVLLAVNGLAMASIFTDPSARAWIVQAMWILVGTSLFSVLLLLPIQERLFDLAASDPPDSPRILRMYVAWSVAGTAVFGPLGAVFYLMVTKQPFA